MGNGPPTGGPPAGGPPPGGPPAAGVGNVLLMTVFIRLAKEREVPDPLDPVGGGITGEGGHCAAAVGAVPVGAVPVEVVVMVAILAIVSDWTCETKLLILGLSGEAELGRAGT
jgi:hypothetical protein